MIPIPRRASRAKPELLTSDRFFACLLPGRQPRENLSDLIAYNLSKPVFI
ncbi:MAG: hypothetical protein JWM11_942 [Planctomycetaceae bacterium]|nr:hypothetical protein [Planctomycetaceae bacterium]